jgi:hypothetical protein
MSPTRRHLLIGAAATLLLPGRLGAAEPLGLVMFREVGCPWCEAWDREVGAVYAQTDIGRSIPLREVYHRRETDHGVALARPVRYSPTFVLVEGTTELARIEGYPGEDFFWGYLERMVAAHAEAPVAAEDAAGSCGPVVEDCDILE